MKKMIYLLVLVFTLAFPICSNALPRRGFMLDTISIDVAGTIQDVNNIADLGGTMVRFPVYFSTPQCDFQCWLNFTDSVYNAANQRRINLVIDFHNPGNTMNSDISDVNDFVAKWGAFARHFGSKTDRVISIWYDLCNEPNHSDWGTVALLAAQEIRKYDGHNPIIYAPRGSVTSASTSSSFRPLPGIGNQVIEFHFWDWSNSVQSPDPNINRNYRYVGNAGSATSTNYSLVQLQAKLENVRAFGERYGVPVYIGEVGIYQGH